MNLAAWTFLVLALPQAVPDPTKGEKKGPGHDWTLGPTGARGWMHTSGGHSALSRQILVSKVAKGSPADGILSPGDVILGIDGRKPTSASHALRILRSYEAGESVKLDVQRKQRKQTITWTVPEREEIHWRTPRPPRPPSPERSEES